ncbi:hypothetical protein BS78_04G085000 [Paspalum vaginatum]|nr:hypothetical protein BS78_04G085000 [Paspalum vaginatum]
MADKLKLINVVSWNVRGLGDANKAPLVLDTLLSSPASIICLQETKLGDPSPSKLYSFLPSSLREHRVVCADGARGGLLTAWDPDRLGLVSSSPRRFSLSIVFQLADSNLSLAVTNVYAPADHSLMDVFLSEMEEVVAEMSGPWLIIGDFNLLHDASEKNTPNFNQSLADAFNGWIQDSALNELPLLDRLFTWSNKSTDPTLARLDRAFFNIELGSVFPNSTLTSLVHSTSDHTPLLASFTTTIPRSTLFRFENSWLKNSTFLPCASRAWEAAPHHGDAAGVLARCLKEVRGAAKVWSRSARAPPSVKCNCKFLLHLFDFLEEHRQLSVGEQALREIAREHLAAVARTMAAYWKQRGKVRAIKHEDACTKYFMAKASQRLRKNQIRGVQCDGQVLYDHQSKTEALTKYYEQLLGSSVPTSWGFGLDRLYANRERVQQDALIAPFSEQEFGTALKSINKNSAPGPDGFGAGFYSAAWNFIKPVVMSFADGFYKGEIQLNRVNRAYIVLLPKKQGTLQPGDFRPISLQNLSVKLLTKVLTMRVQEQIQKIVAIDQTGFIRGRSISENFVLATELVQCCHKRKAAALVFKLDFAKAFDSVDWDSLIWILEVRGFPTAWCGWINDLLRSSMSAVLVNGVPGRWINCKRGLRQGDPISPYLFILVADVLQALITSSGEVHHPLVPSLPCPILQYADDTLLIIPAVQEEVQALKNLLDLFSAATGLRINFQKSTMVPMNVTMEHAQGLQGVMGCKLESFPQVYLGLPLSNVKLNLSTFSAVISKVDKRLAGWQGKLLNAKGRSVLVNSVLDGTVTYSMAALLLPPGVLAALDQRRRAFLCRGDSAWAAWAMEGLDLISLKGPLAVGAHWDALRCILPLYRSITAVRVGSGDATNFWDDVWLGEKTLAEQYPVMFSHALPPAISVADAKHRGLRRFLVPRLTRAAEVELNVLQAALSDIHLSTEPDQRLSPFVRGDGSLQAGSIYRTIKRNVAAAPPFTEFVWNNKAPPKVQYFGWLLVQQRIKCRYNLKRKNIVDDDVCPVCRGGVETSNHLILQCPFAKHIWARLHIDTADHNVSSLWESATHYNMFLLMVSWFLWKHRNDVTFNGLTPCRGRLKAALLDAAPLWRHRLPVASAAVVDSWCSIFSLNM